MKIIPRVLPSAHLVDLKGSVAQREKTAQKFGQDVFSWLKDSFDAKVAKNTSLEVPKSAIQDYFLQKYQGIVARVSQVQAAQWGGQVQYELLGSQRSVASFSVALNLNQKSKKESTLDLLNPKQTEVFFHEHRHLCDYISQPKMLAKLSEKERLFPAGTRIDQKLEKFFIDNIYFCKAKGTNKFFPDKERTMNFRKTVKGFFKEQNFSSGQKIALLQHWRSSVKSEINAYHDGYSQNAKFVFTTLGGFVSEHHIKISVPGGGVFDSLKIETQKRVKAFREYCNKIKLVQINTGKKRFFYPQKLKVLESLLASEIKAHRKEHAAQPRGKN